MRKRQLVGLRIGRLLVLSPTKKKVKRSRNVIWKCLCSCGATKYVASNNLRVGGVTSCGCAKRAAMLDRRFGRLVVLSYAGRNKYDSILWKCRCDCGAIVRTLGQSLRSGRTTSCGCVTKEMLSKNSINILHRTFGQLYVTKKLPQKSPGVILWQCKCICGRLDVFTTGKLLAGHRIRCTRCQLPKTRASAVATILLDRVDLLLDAPMQREYPLKGKFFDGYIPHLHLLIESDGTYWHSSADVLQNDRNKTQIARKFNLTLVRVRVNTLKDIPKAINKIRRYL